MKDTTETIVMFVVYVLTVVGMSRIAYEAYAAIQGCM